MVKWCIARIYDPRFQGSYICAIHHLTMLHIIYTLIRYSGDAILSHDQVVYIFHIHLLGGVYENIPPALRIGSSIYIDIHHHPMYFRCTSSVTMLCGVCMRMWYVLSAWLYHCGVESECVYAAGCLCPCPCVSLNVKVFQEVCISVFVHGRNVGFSCMCTHV